MSETTIQESIERYQAIVANSRSPKTHRAYVQACTHFLALLRKLGVRPDISPASDLTVEWVGRFITYLKDYSVATERLYLTAIAGYYEFAVAEDHATINSASLRSILKRRQRKLPGRIIQFPRENIESVLTYVDRIPVSKPEDRVSRLIALRDRALVFTLADTGLRVAEACRLMRGQIDWREGRAVVIGKGGGEGVIRFSKRSLAKLKAYLNARAPLDGASGKPLSALPLFARHDDGAGNRILPISTVTARKIVDQVVVAAVGPEAKGSITPHSFRHYFVTVVLRGSGGNLKLAQELARHKSIQVTQRYAHISDDELDEGYHGIFNE